MKISSLEARGFRGLPDGTYEFGAEADRAEPITVVRGAPATGKTSLLDAVAVAKEVVGAYGAPPDPARLVRRGAREATLRATWHLSEAERTFAELDAAIVR